MLALQNILRFPPLRLEVVQEDESPLVACVHGENFWIYYSQARASRKVNTINMKGTLKELLEIIPEHVRVFEVSKVSVKVFYAYKMREFDREIGRCTKEEFIQALLSNGAREL